MGEGETGFAGEGSIVYKKTTEPTLQGGVSLIARFTSSRLDTACDPTLCLENYYVENHICAPCSPGASNESGDDATGDDTVCDPILCEANQRVEMNTCVACPAGQENESGDDATSENTTCEDTICSENQFVNAHVCTPCAPGSTRPAGDNATGPNTDCEATICALNQAVINHTCVDCPAGWEASSFDNATQIDTYCVEIFCSESEYVENFACVSCEPGYGSEMMGNAAMTTFTSSTLIDAGLQGPQGLASDGNGNVFVADTSGNQVKRIDGDSNITDIGAGYNGPMAVAVGADGHVFIADTGNGKIKKVDEADAVTESIQTFIWPIDIAIGPFGDVFVADADAQRVFILPQTDFQSIDQTTDGNPTDATQSLDSVTSPGAVAVSDQNVLFVSDQASGEIHRFAQNEYGVWGPDTGENNDLFQGVTALETDAYGNVYVVHTEDATSTVSDSTTNTITDCAYCNQEYFSMDLDPGNISEINWSVSIKDQGSANCATYAYVSLFFVQQDGTETPLGTARNTSDYCNGDRQNYETVYRTWTQGDGDPLQAQTGDRLVMRAISVFLAWEINVNAGDIQVSYGATDAYLTKVNHSGYSEILIGPVDDVIGLSLVDSTHLFVSKPNAGSIISVTGASAQTSCTGITCGPDEYVQDNACTACPAGTTNEEGGDDATGANTTCTATICQENFHVVNHVCEFCPPGTQRNAGDDASGSDTVCETWYCAENERVIVDFSCV